MANGDQQTGTIDFSKYGAPAPASPTIDFDKYIPHAIADTDKTTIGPRPSAKSPIASLLAGEPLSGDVVPNKSGLESLRDTLRESDHPMAQKIADKLDDLQELLFGGQSVGKPLGTKSGIVNNPVTSAMASAPGAATTASAVEGAAARAVSRINPDVAQGIGKTVVNTVLDEIPGYKTASKVAKAVSKVANAGGKIELPASAFDTSEAEAAVTPFEGVGKPAPPKPAPTVRRGPGEIAPERVSSTPETPTPKPTIKTSGDTLLPGGGVIKRPPAGLLPEKAIDFSKYETPAPKATVEAPTPPAAKSISDIVDEATGNTPLAKNVPLRAQTIKGSRVAMETEPRTVAPEKTTATFQEEAGKATGAPPLNPKVSLRQQAFQKPGATQEETPQARLERLYPDSGTRQMVHANGEEIIAAVGDDKALLKSVHDLTNTDVRQALLNSGEDLVGKDGNPITVGNRKAVGNQITRQEAFKRLLLKGHSAADIVKLAKTQPSQ